MAVIDDSPCHAGVVVEHSGRGDDGILGTIDRKPRVERHSGRGADLLGRPAPEFSPIFVMKSGELRNTTVIIG
jgi:hypothetical protein